MKRSERIHRALERHKGAIFPLMQLNVAPAEVVELDFTSGNQALQYLDISDTSQFVRYMDEWLENYARVGIGGYGEDRLIYRRSSLFDGEKEPRSVHLGVDIWVPAGTDVYTPLDSVVHSFRNNDRFGDYGGTIILEHQLDDVHFYTLYGHLGVASLDGMKKGREIAGGTPFATIGAPEENGHWPPHLHFQLISDMLGKEGDFFGVAPPSEKEYFMELCPDPRWILKLHDKR
jgi:murein DD-endopeptidase MepM/ murein hydrolase activator NlpD